jgi:hypothetical protein
MGVIIAIARASVIEDGCDEASGLVAASKPQRPRQRPRRAEKRREGKCVSTQ